MPELVALAGGAFVMGDDAGRADERPAHRVGVAAFRAAVRPVSNAEYDAFVAATGHEASPFRDDPRFAGDERPVAGVSWFDAVAYCEWLSSVSGVAFRLPTEAEREYAARGGIEGSAWPWGNDAPQSRPELRAIVSLGQPHVPGPECANAYGLRCMVDNLHEWCSDWYAPDYYASSPQNAPTGPETGRRRASRGGSWRHMIKFNRLAARSSLDPTYRYNDYGFRVYANA
ncbi:MAG TPA: SUMF1/EgtB/PvdO family nonheme iron enzyme [Dehalococcoidia bacterium]|nr:SUMF1/EgtB/PvdO family nonheme iron enzyme [Dehalococcoidia bacterium]